MASDVDTIRMGLIDDMHLHMRDVPELDDIAAQLSPAIGRALIMPNLSPPITTVEMAHSYRERILSAAHGVLRSRGFKALMALYLTDETTPQEVECVAASPFVVAIKMYPAGATTGSAKGVRDITRLRPTMERMAELGVPLCVHGEVTDTDVDVFDREARFISDILGPLVADLPELRVVVEHCSTAAAVGFVRAHDNVAGTITPQHLLFTRLDLLGGCGLRPHLFCKPVLKEDTDRSALLDAVRSGSPKFFLGSDSAPHARSSKESACCPAGCYSSHSVLAIYAEALNHDEECLANLAQFATRNGAIFYGLPTRNTLEVTLRRTVGDRISSPLPFGGDVVVPLLAGEHLHWSVSVSCDERG